MKLFFKNFVVYSAFLSLTVLVVSCNDDQDGDWMPDNTEYSASEEFEFSFQPPYQAASFILDAISGETTIHCYPGSQIDSIVVYGEKRVNASSTADAEAHLADLQIMFTRSTEAIRFQTDQPEESEGRSYIVEYNIEIPESMSMILSQVNGPITVHDMTADAIISSVNGDVHVQGSGNATASIVNGHLYYDSFEGRVVGSSVNGGIDANVSIPLEGECTLEVTNGDIVLEIPSSTSAEFTASATNGQISYEGLILADATITDNSVTGVLGEGEGAIDLKTTNGNIIASGY